MYVESCCQGKRTRFTLDLNRTVQGVQEVTVALYSRLIATILIEQTCEEILEYHDKFNFIQTSMLCTFKRAECVK